MNITYIIYYLYHISCMFMLVIMQVVVYSLHSVPIDLCLFQLSIGGAAVGGKTLSAISPALAPLHAA